MKNLPTNFESPLTVINLAVERVHGPVPTRQEMLDLAVRGLRSQNFKKCLNDDGNTCLYTASDGSHCAWGWVDPTLASGLTESVFNIPGLAKRLNSSDLDFAYQLQGAHDDAYDSDNMVNRLRCVAYSYNLVFPED